MILPRANALNRTLGFVGDEVVSDPLTLCRRQSHVSFLSVDGRFGCLQTVKNQYDVRYEPVFTFNGYCAQQCLIKSVCMKVWSGLFTDAEAGRKTQAGSLP